MLLTAAAAATGAAVGSCRFDIPIILRISIKNDSIWGDGQTKKEHINSYEDSINRITDFINRNSTAQGLIL